MNVRRSGERDFASFLHLELIRLMRLSLFGAGLFRLADWMAMVDIGKVDLLVDFSVDI